MQSSQSSKDISMPNHCTRVYRVSLARHLRHILRGLYHTFSANYSKCINYYPCLSPVQRQRLLTILDHRSREELYIRYCMAVTDALRPCLSCLIQPLSGRRVGATLGTEQNDRAPVSHKPQLYSYSFIDPANKWRNIWKLVVTSFSPTNFFDIFFIRPAQG